MSNDRKPIVQGSGGIGFLGALAIAFIVLRLVGVIGWSWWWVLAPVWMPAALILGIVAAFLIACGLVAAFAWLWEKAHGSWI